MQRVTYWIFNYEPRWEAVSKELTSLADHTDARFDTHIYSFNMRHRKLKISGRERFYPLPYGFMVLPMLQNLMPRNAINHFFGSAGERIVTRMLAGSRSILTVAKGTRSLSGFERNLSLLKRFRFVIVEAERDKELLQQGGVDTGSIKVIYPGFEIAPYRPVRGPLRLLFASSPFGRYDLMERGLYLIVEAARRLPEVKFFIIWREAHLDRMLSLVGERGLSNVDIHNGYVRDMGEVYDSVHGTVVVALESNSLKPCPHSALESLAHGKPVVTSWMTSLAGIVRDRECGVCCEPNTEDFVAAVEQLRDHYDRYQSRCHDVVSTTFRKDVFLRKYMSIYQEMAEETT
jgi:glycosyltransferase involved in cell wall biosynthesis